MESVFFKKIISSVSAAAITLTSLGIQPFFAVDAASDHSHGDSVASCEEHDHDHSHEHEGETHEAYTGEGVKIAFLDTGVTEYKTEKSVSFIDDDTVDSNHGNNMMSILSSVVPDADVYDVRVLGDDGTGTYDSVYKGIVWAVDNDADVIVMSFVGDKQSALLEKALAYAEENNVFVAASAGNNSAETAYFPAAYPTVISVGAIDECGDIHDYSNFGSYVDTYVQWDDGTSGAAQYIAAEAAIAIEQNPLISVSELRALYKTTEYVEFGACAEDNANSIVSAACSHSFNGQFTTTKATCTEPAKKIGRCTKCNTILSSTVISPALGHSYGSWITSKSATCTASGSNYRTCSRCKGKEYGTISATGHSYGSWTVSRSATCISTGSKYRTCSKCNNKETQSIAKTSHSYSWVITTYPTCAKEGVKKYKCSSCGTVSQTASVAKTSHTFNGQYSTTKQPTCTTKGLKEGKCTKCNTVVDTIDIEATGHSYSWVITTYPTCAKEGVKKYTCSKCGNVSNTASVTKTSHTFNGQYSTTKQPTCTTKGLKEGKCTKCNTVVDTIDIEATGHSYSWVTTKAATCSAAGERAYKCSKCGDVSKTEATAKLSHTFNGQFVTTEPTCTKDGSKVGKCTVCGAVVSSTVIEATGHSYSWVVTKAATCSAEGTRSYKCSKCGDVSKTEATAKLSHTFNGQFVTTEPTCTENGSKVGRCTVCNAVVSSTVLEATGHSYSWVTTKAATCSATGEKSYKCSKCGDVSKTESTAKLSHTFNGQFTTTEPTCTENGSKVGKCTVCGTVVSSTVLKATGHNYDYLYKSQAPTCTSYGYKIYKCSNKNCNAGKTISIYPTGHTFNGQFTTVRKSTCKDTGLKVGKCIKCNNVVTSSPIPTTDHTYGDWIIVQEETCTSYGGKYRKCTVCNEGYSESIPPKTHKFNGSFERKDPTCENDGYIKGKCLNCSHVLTNIVIPRLGGQCDPETIVTKEPTCIEKGVKIEKCKRCKDILSTEEIDETNNHPYRVIGSGENVEIRCSNPECDRPWLDRTISWSKYIECLELDSSSWNALDEVTKKEYTIDFLRLNGQSSQSIDDYIEMGKKGYVISVENIEKLASCMGSINEFIEIPGFEYAGKLSDFLGYASLASSIYEFSLNSDFSYGNLENSMSSFVNLSASLVGYIPVVGGSYSKILGKLDKQLVDLIKKMKEYNNRYTEYDLYYELDIESYKEITSEEKYLECIETVSGGKEAFKDDAKEYVDYFIYKSMNDDIKAATGMTLEEICEMINN